MDMHDAKVETIPQQTRGERRESDLQYIKGEFKGEDVTGLDLACRRGRKVSIDIEEYLKNLDYNPNEIEVDDLQDEPGFFKKNYKMTLRQDLQKPDDDKLDTFCEKTTNYDTILSPKVRFNRNKYLDDKVAKLEPLKMDLGTNIKDKILQSMKERAFSGACLRNQKHFSYCPSLSNVRVFTRHNSLIKASSKHVPIKSKLLAHAPDELVVFDDMEEVIEKAKLLKESMRRSYRFENSSSKLGSETTELTPEQNTLHPMFLNQNCAVVLEFKTISGEAEESPEPIQQEELVMVHVYSPHDEMGNENTFRSFSSRLESLLKEEGTFSFNRFLFKLSEYSPASSPTKKTSSHYYGALSVGNNKSDTGPGQNLQAMAENQTYGEFNEELNRRRSRHVDFDEDYADEYPQVFSRERAGARDTEGSFSL